MPAALTAMRISPALTSGSGRSCTWSTSGPPFFVITTARMRAPYGLEIDRVAVGEARHLQNAVDRPLLDRRVSGQDHDGLAVLGLGPDRGGDDVHALLAEA